MSAVYLSDIRIQNFRAYGPEFSLSLPAGPGLLLICGSNGLGKTTFFEAAEWALTGTVARLADELKGKPILRRLLRDDGFAPAAASCRVELRFGASGSIVREAARGGEDAGALKVLGPNGQPLVDVSAFLQASHWKPEIREVGQYLSLTHFLSQSERPRFFRKEGPRMWESLSGPTGADRLESLRALLDASTGNAFKRALYSALEERERAEIALRAWAERSDELNRLRASATAGAGLSPSEVRAEMAELWLVLGNQVGPIEDAGVPEATLARLAEALARREEQNAKDLQRATTGIVVARSWQEATDTLTTAQGEVEAIELQAATAREALMASRKTADDAATEQNRLTVRHAQLAQRHAALSSLLTAAEGEAAEARNVAAAREAYAQAELQFEMQDSTRVEAQAVLTRHAEIQVRRSQLSEELSALRALDLRILTCIAAEQSARDRESERPGLIQRLVERQQALAKAKAEEQRLTTERAAADARFAEAEKTAGAIEGAVARLATLLGENDTKCPLCATDFPQPGILRSRAHDCATRLQASLEPLLEVVGAARQALAVAVERSATAVAQLDEIDRALEQNAAERSAAADIRRALDAEPRLAGRSRDEQSAFVAASIANATQLDERLAAAQADLTTYAETLARRDAAAAAAAAAAVTRGAARAMLLSAEERQARWAAQRTALANQGVALNENLEDLRSQLDISHSELAASTTQLSQIEDTARQATERRDAAEITNAATQARIATSRSAIARLEHTRTSIAERWMALGFPMPPSEAVAKALHIESEDTRTHLRRLSDKRDAAARGWSAWQSYEALQHAEERRRAELQPGATPEAHAATLALRVAEARRQEVRVQQAEELAGRLAQRLRDQQQLFTDTVLSPLGDRVSAFERMLSPFQHQVIFTNQHRSDSTTRFRVTIGVRRASTGEVVEHDLHTRLSEGQVSAVGVSMIFGASTAYDWSRWRSLWLDDPLQHTDLIHTAAFIDVLRALVLEREYQVVLSSHDLAEAEFIERKCRRFNIPVQRCLLIGAGEDGVRWRSSDDF